MASGLWQQALTRYPDGLADAIIAVTVALWHCGTVALWHCGTVALWHWPHWLDTHWALVERAEHLGLAGLLVDDLKAALRVLFAVNRRWESGVKWLRTASGALTVKPDRFSERVEAVFASQDPPNGVRLCLELVHDILALVPERDDVARARHTVRAALRAQRAR